MPLSPSVQRHGGTGQAGLHRSVQDEAEFATLAIDTHHQARSHGLLMHQQVAELVLQLLLASKAR